MYKRDLDFWACFEEQKTLAFKLNKSNTVKLKCTFWKQQMSFIILLIKRLFTDFSINISGVVLYREIQSTLDISKLLSIPNH